MRLEQSHSRTFQENEIPSNTKLAGWAAIAQALAVKAPLRRASCVSGQHIKGSRRNEEFWDIFDQRYWPGDDFEDHLAFALKNEKIDLLVLKRVFESLDQNVVIDLLRKAPTGIPGRRAWFYYELLTGRTLNVPDASGGNIIDALDTTIYFTGKPQLSRRHRVRDNLLGTASFCPMIRQTTILKKFVASKLGTKASEIIGRTRAQLVARAASFMLLADSRASFEIEGERPPRTRLERWGRAVLKAGKNTLTRDEIIRLHNILIEDTRFVHPGLRPDGVFLGERDYQGDPLPEFIGARPPELEGLMRGLLDANTRMRESDLDPVLQAAATAFGFVYVHPFQDGNGRLHRCLIHHVLAERKLTPPGMVFPVSSVMLDQIDRYRETLRNHSGPLMDLIEWRTTPERNVEVLNETADLYRYFDCTGAAEFLYGCVERTVERDLPQEIDYLRRHDEAMRRIMDMVEMPDSLADSLVMFIRQNKGKLGKIRRENEFGKLTDQEVNSVEMIVRQEFEGFAEA